MKKKLVELLCCPRRRHPLELKNTREEGNEIKEDKFICSYHQTVSTTIW